MDISIDIFVDEDLKKIDEMLYVDVNIIPIGFRVRYAFLPQRISFRIIILEKSWMHTCGDPTSKFRPKLSKRDISLPVSSLYAYMEDGCTCAMKISV